jgi:alpha-mannosidase
MHHKTRWTVQRVEKYLTTIEPLVYRSRQTLPPFRYLEMEGPGVSTPVGLDIDDRDWAIVGSNSYWAKWFTDFTLRTYFSVPPDWDDKMPAALHLPLGLTGDFSHPEALVYIDGQPLAGCDRHHQEIILSTALFDGQSHLLALHGWTGRGGWPTARPGTRPFMGQCNLVQIDNAVREFIKTARVALGVARAIDEDEPAHGRLLNALLDAFNRLALHKPLQESFFDSLPDAQKLLDEGIAAAGPALDVELHAVGHAHLDIAWLWSVEQSRRKAARTFYSVDRLMGQFPNYHFTQSQPQLYEYVRQDYPDLFDRISQRISEGRWEPIGGMWVEADCNLSGAESLARQFLLGRSFFREHFGQSAESPVLWLPDVFGYAWALPQLIKQAELEYFFTIKIGWSQYNRLPYDSFWWQGIDGSKVLTHFSTTPEINSRYASTYNADASPASVIGTWRNFQQKELQHTLLMAYGYGDGGGGPTSEMLENLGEMARFPATPHVKQGKVIEFFRTLEEEAGEALPTWNGELYLELHRGTYTTQGRSKRAARRSEFLLHDAEFLASFATRLGSNSANYHYPGKKLARAWQLVCLNQFHDIIPGSSIGEVYKDSLREYAEISEIGETIRLSALEFIGQFIGGDLLLVNPTSFQIDVPVCVAGGLSAEHMLVRDGRAAITQKTNEGFLIDSGPLPPYSITSLNYANSAPHSQPDFLEISPMHLENKYLYISLNEAGDITGIYDKVNQRNVIPPGTIANQLQLFEDRPLNWDAWDIDIYYEDKMVLAGPATSIQVLERGLLRASLQIKRHVLNSTVTQTISLFHNQAQLDFDTVVDWQEEHMLLKAAFPVEILSPAATFEIQWGNVERPTHRNTSWDWARFETCAHKWIDLSEGNYGVSLLNDCKYGHDVRENVMRISLLRGSTFPDPGADRGVHHFAYSLRPHANRWNEETIAAAYALNDPPFAFVNNQPAIEETGAVSNLPLVKCSHPNVIIETIKGAEDGNGLIIRLYESQRHRGLVTLTFAFKPERVWRTNLLEDNREIIQHTANQVDLLFKPYEIVTLRIE